METDKKQEYDAANAPLQSEPRSTEKKETVPGEQIGLYSEPDGKEVCQTVNIINPDKNSLESR